MSGHPGHGLSRPTEPHIMYEASARALQPQLDLELKGLVEKILSEKTSLSYTESSVSSLNFIYSKYLNFKSFLNETGLAPQ